jgi:hypothetical protein
MSQSLDEAHERYEKIVKDRDLKVSTKYYSTLVLSITLLSTQY